MPLSKCSVQRRCRCCCCSRDRCLYDAIGLFCFALSPDCSNLFVGEHDSKTISIWTEQVHLNALLMHQNLEPTDVHSLHVFTFLVCLCPSTSAGPASWSLTLALRFCSSLALPILASLFVHHSCFPIHTLPFSHSYSVLFNQCISFCPTSPSLIFSYCWASFLFDAIVRILIPSVFSFVHFFCLSSFALLVITFKTRSLIFFVFHPSRFGLPSARLYRSLLLAHSAYAVCFYAWFLLFKRVLFFPLPVLFDRFVASAFACVYAFQLAVHLFGSFVGSFALSLAVSFSPSRCCHRVQWSYTHKHSVVVYPCDDAIGRENKTRSNRHTLTHDILNNNKPKKGTRKWEIHTTNDNLKRRRREKRKKNQAEKYNKKIITIDIVAYKKPTRKKTHEWTISMRVYSLVFASVRRLPERENTEPIGINVNLTLDASIQLNCTVVCIGLGMVLERQLHMRVQSTHNI